LTGAGPFEGQRRSGRKVRAGSDVCRRFVELCRELKLFSQATAAIDGSKFEAVNARDRNFTPNNVKQRREQIELNAFRCAVTQGYQRGKRRVVCS
jgi:hypothetical protein